jgi:uncharacterized protein (DUF1330 family)
MAYDWIIGLNVTDAELYRQYRAEMTPLLEAAGGQFAYDFDIARTHRNASAHEINRVFVIRFPDRAACERYFQDPAYLAIRAKYFERAVRGVTVLAESGG